MARFDLILFDIDGTLLRTQGAGRAATRLALERTFGTAGNVAAHEFSGKTDWRTLEELLIPVGFTQAQVKDGLPRFRVAMAEALAEVISQHAVSACPGVFDLLAALHARGDVLLGLITGNMDLSAPVKLRAAHIDPAQFAVGAYGNDARDRNDLPAVALQRASAHLGRPVTAARTLIIGDTLMDVDCARAVGAPVCAVGTGFEVWEKLVAAQPDYLLPDLTTFLEVVAL